MQSSFDLAMLTPFERKVAQIESSLNPHAKNKNSSAKGLFQFIDSTADQYGLDRSKFGTDEYTQSELDAFRQLTANNENHLKGVLGRDLTDGEKYLAHQQGAKGAERLLTNPDARAVDVVGEKAVKLNGGDENMTAQQFANQWISKIDGEPQEAQEEYIQIETPDGEIVEFPSDMDEAEILAIMAEQFPPIEEQVESEEEKGAFGRIKDNIIRRNNIANQAYADRRAGKITKGEEILRQAGQGGGIMLDIGGEAFNAALGALGSAAKLIAPKALEEKTAESFDEAAEYLSGSKVGKISKAGVKKVSDAYSDFSERNPRAAKNLEAMANIGMVAAPVKVKPKGKSAKGIVGKAGDKLDKAAVAQTTKQNVKYANDLVLPLQNTKQLTEQVGRTTEKGLFGSKSVQLTVAEQKMANEVAKLPLKPKGTLQTNYNIIQGEVAKEAKSLAKALDDNPVFFPRREFGKRIQDAKDILAESPTLVGDAAITAEKIMKKYDKILKNHPSSASGLLKARKELDAWAKSQKAKVFDGKEGAFDIALREIRNTTNDFIEEKATAVAVKDSLKKQSNLYRAMDNIAPKAAREGKNKIERAINNVKAVIPLKGDFMQTLGAFGLAGVAAKVGSPAIATGAGLYGLGKAGQLVLQPSAKKALSQLLKKTDDAIRVTKDKDLIRQLRLDRAALVEVIEGEVELEEETQE